MKNVIAILLASGLALGVAGCEPKATNAVSKDAKVVKTEKVVKKEEAAKPVSVEDLAKKVGSLSVRVKRLEDLAKSRGVQ